MKPSDFFIFGVFVVMMMATSAYIGHSIGFVDGALDERALNKNKLESCQRVLAGNNYER